MTSTNSADASSSTPKPQLLGPHTSIYFYHPNHGYIQGTISELIHKKRRKRKHQHHHHGNGASSALHNNERDTITLYRCSSQHMDEDHLDVKPKYVFETRLIQQALQQPAAQTHDLLSVLDLNEASLQLVVENRFLRDDIYTFIGPIVLALNPFKWDIPHVQDDQMIYYMNQKSGLRPHSWSVADDAYRSMIRGEGNQSILVSGVSGAGKTEASKTVAKYLAALSTSMTTDPERKRVASGIATKIQESSPILEAFGNAKTINNDNSSRFGKFIKLQFDRDGVILGASIVQYLLERSRVIAPGPNERSYHIFYQFLAGISDQERDMYQLGDVEDFPCLVAGDCTSVDTIDDVEDYRNTRAAMDIIGLSSEEQENVFSVLAAILHLNRLTFSQDEDDQAFVENTDPLSIAARLLHVDAKLLEKVLITKKLVIMNNPIIKKLNSDGAIDARDALMKALYVNLFNWLIEKINGEIAAPNPRSVHSFIGLLDIFGFEEFEVNSFEQLCINFSNEALQHHYNSVNFKRDMKECRDEGIDVTSVKFNDNTPCIELIKGSKKQSGILELLDSQCSFPKATDESFLNLTKNTFHKKHPYFDMNPVKHEEFYVKHFAGKIEYNTKYWLDKNKDLLKDDILEMLQGSSSKFVSKLVPPPIRVKGKLLTVGGHFKNQLNDLLSTINSTVPHWIRCIKPHPSKKPNRFHNVEVMNQLRSSGVLATIKMRREGFSVRLPHSRFWNKFRVLVHESSQNMSREALIEACKRVLSETNQSSTDAQVGKTKVFMRPHSYSALEKLRTEVLAQSVTEIQSYARMASAIRQVEKIRQRIKLEKLRGEVARRKKEMQLIRSIREEQQFINTDLARKEATLDRQLSEMEARREKYTRVANEERERLIRLRQHMKRRKELFEEEQRRAAEERARLIAALEEEKRQREEEEKRRKLEAKREKERRRKEAEERAREERRQEILRLEQEESMRRRKELEEQQLKKLQQRNSEQQKCAEEYQRNRERARIIFEQEQAEREHRRQEKLLEQKEQRDRRIKEQKQWERREYQRLRRELFSQKQMELKRQLVEKKRRFQVKQTQKLKEHFAEEKKRRIHQKMLRTSARKKQLKQRKQQEIRMKKQQYEYRKRQVLYNREEQDRYLSMKQEELDMEREREKKLAEMKKQIQHEISMLEVEQSWEENKQKEREQSMQKGVRLKRFEEDMERRKSLSFEEDDEFAARRSSSSPLLMRSGSERFGRLSGGAQSARLPRSSPLAKGLSLDFSRLGQNRDSNGYNPSSLSARRETHSRDGDARSQRSVSPTHSIHSIQSTSSRGSIYEDLQKKSRRKKIPKAGTFSLYG